MALLTSEYRTQFVSQAAASPHYLPHSLILLPLLLTVSANHILQYPRGVFDEIDLPFYFKLFIEEKPDSKFTTPPPLV